MLKRLIWFLLFSMLATAALADYPLKSSRSSTAPREL